MQVPEHSRAVARWWAEGELPAEAWNAERARNWVESRQPRKSTRPERNPMLDPVAIPAGESTPAGAAASSAVG
ncbi:hypothetical protein Kisp02_58870 [Kineosporia sp. NBRC 101731]|nr:hypothetical protein Kisp02_58870 [Kineosporia sp. NBRC 101731]